MVEDAKKQQNVEEQENKLAELNECRERKKKRLLVQLVIIDVFH